MNPSVSPKRKTTDGKGHLLIVDDEPDIVFPLAELLKRKSYPVQTALSGQAALRILHKKAIDILITDIRMPVMDGLALIRRAMTLLPDLQAIVLTGNGDLDNAIEALRLGASNYLQKPMDLREMELALERCTEKIRLIHKVREQERQLMAANLELEKKVRERTAALQQANNKLLLLAKIFHHSNEGIIITDPERVILDVNPAFCKCSGYCEEEAVGEKACFHHAENNSENCYKTMERELRQNGHWQGEIWNRKKEGIIWPSWSSVFSIPLEDGTTGHYIEIIHNITEPKKKEARLVFTASHDGLTGLPNRLLFQDRLTVALSNMKRTDQKLAILFLDIDNFKPINDTYGHAIGDKLLQTLAGRLGELVRETDTVSRFGGDEFVLLVSNFRKTRTIINFANKLVAAMEPPFRIEGQELCVNVSIGVAVYPHHGTTQEELLLHADNAMFLAKQDKRRDGDGSRFKCFDELPLEESPRQGASLMISHG